MVRGDLRIVVVFVGLLLGVLVNWKRVEGVPLPGGRFVHGSQEDSSLIGDGGREDGGEIMYGGRHSFGERGIEQNGDGEGSSMRSVYLDSSHFLPYIHPKLIFEEDLPQQQFLPRNTKRATKGMSKSIE